MLNAFSTSGDRFPKSFHHSEETTLGVQQVFEALSCVHGMYPGFKEWLFGKVVAASSGERAIFIETSGPSVLGIAIAKRSMLERKLCTLWVQHDARGGGVASSLANAAFDWLGTSRPLFSVPEERLSEFRSLLRSWEFVQSQALSGYYRPNKTEFVFNGILRASLNS
jgi:hypothetical protein